jgi:hypothetical protein
MSAPELERTLARLFADREFRRAFLRDPPASLAPLDLTPGEKSALCAVDRAGLVMAAESYRRKRARYRERRGLMKRFVEFARSGAWLPGRRSRAKSTPPGKLRLLD